MSARVATWRRTPSGRLFWKFFFFFWAAQVLTSIGVGITVWAHRPDHLAFSPAPQAEAEAVISSERGTFRLPPRDYAGLPGMRPPHIHPWRPPLIPMLAGCLASLIFAALLAWYFARPIRVLRTAFNDVAEGRLQTRVGAAMGRRRDELADLGSEFDRMADRLQFLIESQRRLLHDVSHEMRSPLARIQAALDLMRQQPGRAAEFASRIERDSARMDALVGELLTLARLDAAPRSLADSTAEVVDLADLLTAIAEDAEFEAAGDDGQPCRIDTDFSSPLPVRGDRELLHRALENVVRNAVRYGRRPGGSADTATDEAAESLARGCVAVSARVLDLPAGRRIEVVIADRGPGVAAENLDQMFVPFFRGESAAPGGYGLGLAITRRVINAHGGKVSASNREAGGLAVTIVLPAA